VGITARRSIAVVLTITTFLIVSRLGRTVFFVL
jgi:hypothetical protein